MSSSHLFLGLPIALLVLFVELRSGFHSAAFFNHLSLGDVAILSANFHFIFCVSCSSNESFKMIDKMAGWEGSNTHITGRGCSCEPSPFVVNVASGLSFRSSPTRPVA